MKSIALILLAYFGILLVSPLGCSKTSSNVSMGQTKSQSDTPCQACCSIQSCHCNFLGAQSFDFPVQIVAVILKQRIQNDKVLSNYLSDCWRPPKVT